MGDFKEERTWYLLRCLKSIRSKTQYQNYEILVADNGDMPPELAAAIKPFDPIRISYTKPGRFSLTDKFNFMVNQASGPHILLMNDDMEVISPDWIDNMMEYSQQESIGAVGGKLFFPDNTLQHVGVFILKVGPGHPFYKFSKGHNGYYNNSSIVHNVSAVTGSCLMTRKSVYQEVGGFSENLPLDYNDVDYCLKLLQRGYRVVYTPYTRIRHYESATRSNTWESGLDKFKKNWAGIFTRDPYYNQNLSQCNADYRIGLPWLGEAES
jgi:GT2 family glycosyltransferase